MFCMLRHFKSDGVLHRQDYMSSGTQHAFQWSPTSSSWCVTGVVLTRMHHLAAFRQIRKALILFSVLGQRDRRATYPWRPGYNAPPVRRRVARYRHFDNIAIFLGDTYGLFNNWDIEVTAQELPTTTWIGRPLHSRRGPQMQFIFCRRTPATRVKASYSSECQGQPMSGSSRL